MVGNKANSSINRGLEESVNCIFMKGRKEALRNHKLTSLTSISGKVIEQLTLETMFKHIKEWE